MKNKVQVIVMAFCSVLGWQTMNAQNTIGDQNPNYRVSMDKYMVQKDSILGDFGTTAQQTYKAYDWYEAKQEKKALRRQNRHELRMTRAQNPGYNYSGYGSGYYGFSNYNNWRYNLIPSIGFRTGNWSFYW